MESQIGSVLRRARNRRGIELSEVEAATRIRARFLRAIENEEWDALPGGVYTRGFIRAYASFLGLDGDRLVEDYRTEVEGPQGGRGPDHELAPIAASTATGSASRGRRSPLRLGWLAAAAVLLVAAIAIAAPWRGGDGEGGAKRSPASQAGATDGGNGSQQTKAATAAKGVSVRLAALSEVWVCLLGGKGEPLVEGQVLEAGAEEGPFRSGSFTVSLGNGEVSMLIDGKQAEIPPTASPIGYSIDSAGRLTELGETERPSCL
ncbi:MAG TPA: helix-turn-helix domain-containing protein [Solirubrobacterales bacterium]|nr:helix-turn-helix domain-containing protein [Solirubrobacterales bacterium]